MKSLIASASLTYTADLKPCLTLVLATDRKTAQDGVTALTDALAQGKQLQATIEPVKKKRSLNANSYFWVLVDKVAKAIRSTPDEVYITMLTRYGQREPQLLSVIAEGAPMVYRATNNHCTEVGESELNGKTFKHLAVLIGSSEYDTKSMSILIDGIVSECKLLDIETMPQSEIDSLINSWGCNVTKHKNATKEAAQ